MRSVMYNPCLVLNQTYEPVAIASARRAVTLIVKDAAYSLEEGDREIHRGFRLPTVIRLKQYRHVPHRVQVLTRRNVLMRDKNTCQYCGVVLPSAELTLDHVLPSSRGGKSVWENLVAACGTCNRKKADQTPEEAGMILLRRPRPVTLHTARGILRAHGETEKHWQKYLYYDNAGSTQYVTQG